MKIVLRCKSCLAPIKIHAFNFLEVVLSPCNGEADDENYTHFSNEKNEAKKG